MSVDMFNCVCSSKKIERDAGLSELQRILPNLDQNSRFELQKSMLQTLNDCTALWEAKLGCLMGVKFLIQFINMDCDRESDFARNILPVAQTLLVDQAETRVQIAAGEVIGALCAKVDSSVYQESRDIILGLIQKGLENSTEVLESEQIVGGGQRRLSTEIPGCGSLEASLKALQAIVEGCGASFAPHIDQELLRLLAGALQHKSRGVREAAFYLAATVASCSADAEHRGDNRETGAIFDLGQTLLASFADGLADEWSPVRLAASVAVRRFLLALPNSHSRQAFYPLLLPRMCLNRYYAAEGVRIYSQETWRQVAGCAGKELVQHHLSTIIEFYSQSTQSPSYAVREAACTCIAELATKLQPDCVRPHVLHLIKILLQCFNDDSWPVRDAACLACGNFILSFPSESQAMLPDLYPMFFRNLEDAIPSVRAGAASALSNIVRALGETALTPLLAKITEGLQGLAHQPSDVAVVVERRQGLCGAVTPRLGRAGSTDHRFHRPPQPWELADGCVSLLAELATIPHISPHLTPVLPLLAEACTKRHYMAHLNFLETICKNLPIIARGVGKKNFKAQLENFIEPVFYALESENALTSSAASQCLNQLSVFVGPNILRARVQAHSPSHLRHLDANLFIAPF